jgi:SAM-dependent methyltransferase
MESNPHNLDRPTVDDFGREWQRFDQRSVSSAEVRRRFGEYFALFPWDSLPRNAVGFDAGCGSGRWAALVAPRVGRLHCIDASADALSVAQKSLSGLSNVEFHAAPLEAMPLPDDGMDFGYSLGVLHHLPDPAAGLAVCVRKLKRGAPMLVYIYYAFENRPAWFRLLWRASDLLRHALSKAPFRLKSAVADFLLPASIGPWRAERGYSSGWAAMSPTGRSAPIAGAAIMQCAPTRSTVSARASSIA